MKSVKNITTYSWVIKKSEFICTLIPCNDENEIQSIINKYKEQYQDASHNCIAYIVNLQERAMDDGEPSGTAGLPMLNVLQKQGLSNIIAIVTRYYGGIKLGAGGLTRAYTQSVADALKEAEIVEKHPVPLYRITLGYSFNKKMDHLLKVQNIQCINKEYENEVTYMCYIPDSTFFDQIQDLTNNTYTKKFIREEYIELP
ncbi:MAG: YigZ family protein [Coprobacillaceae bacterium]